MTAVLIILAAIVLLVIGYVTYGSWLAKQWGVDPSRKTPAVEMEDGVDYVAAKPAVLMGHHFSSIAGAGPINGPIQASVFGWVPVFLWCVIGGIFFGGLQDFGSLFASIRNEGKSVGEIIKTSMGDRAKKLFILFALLVLIMVIASFVNVVAGTFAVQVPEGGADPSFFSTSYDKAQPVLDEAGEPVMGEDGKAVTEVVTIEGPSGEQTTAMVSVLFIILAIIYGMLTNKAHLGTVPATIIGLLGIVVAIVIGLNVGIGLSRTAWVVLIGVYITVASLIPVWIMLQPRDYLSSFLLYAMMAVAVVGIFFSAFTGDKTATFELPAFTGWTSSLGGLFPALFITVACGACSGFHSLISTGTSSKQLDNEAHAKPIGYGSMLIESALGVVSLIAVGMVFTRYQAKEFGSPAVAFATGIASMFSLDTASHVYNVIYTLLTLAVSVFALTSLDTGTRLSRFMFTELFLKDGEATYKDASGARKFLAHPLVGTLFMVIVGCYLGLMKLDAIWALFGAANQLLAGLALMAVAAWLGQIGKNNKMFYIPMVFMLVATLTSLIINIKGKILLVTGKTLDAAGEVVHAVWGDWFQFIIAIAMVVLAVFLVIEGISTFSKQLKKDKAKA